jgi:hypothetical protein
LGWIITSYLQKVNGWERLDFDDEPIVEFVSRALINPGCMMISKETDRQRATNFWLCVPVGSLDERRK